MGSSRRLLATNQNFSVVLKNGIQGRISPEPRLSWGKCGFNAAKLIRIKHRSGDISSIGRILKPDVGSAPNLVVHGSWSRGTCANRHRLAPVKRRKVLKEPNQQFTEALRVTGLERTNLCWDIGGELVNHFIVWDLENSWEKVLKGRCNRRTTTGLKIMYNEEDDSKT